MKYRLWVIYFLAIALLFPLASQQASQGLTATSVYQRTQRRSTYDLLMIQGYAAHSQRNYRRALQLFQQALAARPGDKYAIPAIANVKGYIARGSRQRIGITGKPFRVASAATRGECFQNQKPPIPLLPPGRAAVLTTKEYPTFYFYIPSIGRKTQAMEFVLRDDDNITPLYRESFRPVRQSGIISIRIPSNRQPLQLGKQYTWGFSLVCNRRQRDEDLYAEGKIERVQNENLNAQLQQTQRTLDRAVLYTIGGLWENAFSTVAALRSERPNDPVVKKYWVDLLDSLKQLGAVGVTDAVNKPFLPCCNSQQKTSNKTKKR